MLPAEKNVQSVGIYCRLLALKSKLKSWSIFAWFQLWWFEDISKSVIEKFSAPTFQPQLHYWGAKTSIKHYLVTNTLDLLKTLERAWSFKPNGGQLLLSICNNRAHTARNVIKSASHCCCCCWGGYSVSARKRKKTEIEKILVGYVLRISVTSIRWPRSGFKLILE